VASTPYTITVSAGSLSAGNYDFPNLVNGTLTVTKAHLTVTADNQSKLYGAALPPMLTHPVTTLLPAVGPEPELPLRPAFPTNSLDAFHFQSTQRLIAFTCASSTGRTGFDSTASPRPRRRPLTASKA
jgi:hypothetical protein